MAPITVKCVITKSLVKLLDDIQYIFTRGVTRWLCTFEVFHNMAILFGKICISLFGHVFNMNLLNMSPCIKLIGEHVVASLTFELFVIQMFNSKVAEQIRGEFSSPCTFRTFMAFVVHILNVCTAKTRFDATVCHCAYGIPTQIEGGRRSRESCKLPAQSSVMSL